MIRGEGWPEGLNLLCYDRIDSTNEAAHRLHAAGEKGPVWIVAREQTKGRGRRGRIWVSRRGNLFATLILPACPPRSTELAFVAGLAVRQALSRYAAPGRLALKWPNDVLLNGRKIAGILLEALGHDSVAVGIGINLAHHPEDTPYPAISLAAVAADVPSPGELLARLARAMAAWHEAWQTQGFGLVKQAWLAHAAGLNGAVTATLAGSDMRGMFEGLDGDGALLLREQSGTLRRITAGEVFFRG